MCDDRADLLHCPVRWSRFAPGAALADVQLTAEPFVLACDGLVIVLATGGSDATVMGVDGTPSFSFPGMGRALLLPAGRAIRICATRPRTLRLLQVSNSLYTRLRGNDGHAPDLPEWTTATDSAALESLLMALWGIVATAPMRVPDDAALYALLGLIVREAAAARSVRTAAPRGTLAAWQLRLVCERIRQTLAEPVSLADLAGSVGLSVFHFARAFRESTGMPPYRYMVSARIEEAKRLLALGDLPVTHIAFEVGYESSQALSRAFRQATGCSPAAWRRLSLAAVQA